MKLIITRPLADSKRMQDYFELRGVECLINPLLEILYKRRNINFSNYDRVLFTSRHAVRSLVNKNPTFSKKNCELEKFFFKYKCKYFHLQCYSALKVNKKKSLFKKFMISENDKLITIYSSLTARSFIDEVKKLDLIEFCKDKIFIVISENVKKELTCLGQFNIEVVKKPKENEMINLLVKKSRG